MDEKQSITPNNSEELFIKAKKNENEFSAQEALEKFNELKEIALNCLDKNGNPNISAALRAVENMAKIAGLYKHTGFETRVVAKMGEIKIDGEQLKLNIGEDFTG